MSEIEFIFEGTFIIIQCKSEEKFEEIIKRFIIKAGKKKDELIFIYGGGFIDENLTFNEQANEMDKSRNKMSIIVSKKNEKNLDEQSSFKKSNYIICPKCKESARILINNYKIELYNCKKGHKTNDILINDFDKTQNLEETEIICLNCNKVNKNTSYNNMFFICFDCKKNLCPLCKSIHDKTHNIIDYDEKYFICDLHYESYNSYCTDCNTDICIICENQHNGHKILSYGKIFPDIKKIKEKVNDFISKKEAFKNDIKNIINKLNILMSTMDKYFEINEDIIKCYGNKKRNYSLLQNINDMDRFNDNVMRDLNKIINENNICHKIENIIDIYNKMNQKDYKNNIKLSEIENNNDNKQQKNNINTKDKIEINNKENHDIKNKEDEGGKKNEEVKEFKGDGKSDNTNENINKMFNINKINNDLMITSEKDDSNYKDFDITKMKQIVEINSSLKTISDIFVLKDGRLLIYPHDNGLFKKNFKSFVFDIKNNNLIELNIERIEDIIQMDDDIVIIATDDEIKLINIKEKDFEIIQTMKIKAKKLLKMSEHKILVFDSNKKMYFFPYENKNLKSVNETKIKGINKLDINHFHIFKINENELAISYTDGIFTINRNVGFFDLKNGKKLKSFNVAEWNLTPPFCLINKDIFVFYDRFCLITILLSNHSKEEFYMSDVDFRDSVESIISLNEKKFIVTLYNRIKLFELKGVKNIININTINLNCDIIKKYPKSRLLIKEKKNESSDSSIINLFY